MIGVENTTGSPFNIQRSLNIPNLSFDEVEYMFKWYEKETKQKIDPKVICKLYDELNGQPGLISWFGELLTETYNKEADKPITLDGFTYVFRLACHALPNNNILNRYRLEYAHD